jgi:hypothetical protein
VKGRKVIENLEYGKKEEKLLSSRKKEDEVISLK